MAEDDFAAAQALLAAGDKPGAFNRLIAARSVAGDDQARLDAIADGMEQAGQHRSALELRETIIRVRPDDAAARLAYLRAKTKVVGGDDSGQRTIENELDALVAVSAAMPAALWLEASEVYGWVHAIGKQRSAIARAVAAGAGSLEIARRVAFMYCYSGRRWRAWWALRKLLRRADLPAHYMAELSHVSRETGFPATGLRFARRLLGLEPGNLDALVLEAKALRAKGRTRQAAARVKGRLEGFMALQDHGHLAVQAAQVLAAGGELAAERTLLQQAAVTWPDNQDVATALQVARFGAWGNVQP